MMMVGLRWQLAVIVVVMARCCGSAWRYLRVLRVAGHVAVGDGLRGRSSRRSPR